MPLSADTLPDIQARLRDIPRYWSEIAALAGVGYATVEGLAKQRPGRCNPRLATLWAITRAVITIEERMDAPTLST